MCASGHVTQNVYDVKDVVMSRDLTTRLHDIIIINYDIHILVRRSLDPIKLIVSSMNDYLGFPIYNSVQLFVEAS